MFKSALCLVLMILSLTRAAAHETPSPQEVHIEGFTYSGSGCPPGSVASNLSPDVKALTLLFDSYQVEASHSLSQKACQVNVQMHSPRGYSFALFTVDYRGYADLKEGAQARQETLYHFGPSGGPLRSLGAHVLNAPHASDYHFRNTIPLESLTWSSCDGSSRQLALVTTAGVDAHTGGSGLMTVDSFDGELVHQYGIAWRRCPVLDANEPFVVGLYKDTLGRRPSQGELDGWLAHLHHGATRQQVALGFLTSRERREGEIASYYVRFLGRHAAPAEIHGWVQSALSGTTSSEMQTGFLSSPEFYARQGNSPHGFALGLFRVLFEREPSGQDVAWWAKAVNKHGQNHIANTFVNIQEHHLRLVMRWYQGYLRRGASLAEAQAWAQPMGGRNGQELVLSHILGSDEYFRLKQNEEL